MKSLLKATYKNLLTAVSVFREPYSRLILAGDKSGWVLDWEMREVGRIAKSLGIRLAGEHWRYANSPQSVFYANQFFLLYDEWLGYPHRVGLSYFHGLPGMGESLFDRVYESLCKYHHRISRIQASHTQMQNVILESGIDPSKVFLIPIGINLDYFPLRTNRDKWVARKELGIPESAFVIGSFQKDGVGWGDGLEPKLIKGPDIFLSVVKELKSCVPELFALISGPARGYIKEGLEKLGIPFKHLYLDSYPKIGPLFRALDTYLVTSRQEGGPKAVLESMASGVPIISTRVGQATDLIQHGVNGWLVNSEDVNGLVECVLDARNLNDPLLHSMLAKGRATAEANSYEAQIPMWNEFMKGFVSWQ